MKPRSRMSSSPPMKSALVIVNILTPAAHNNPQYRVASELCPGKRGSEWRAGDLTRSGHAEMLRIKLARLIAESGVEGVKEECNSMDANLAAKNGHLSVVRELRAHGIHCTSDGANMAAWSGHLDVIQDLRARGIHCTANGADWAARNGHLGVVRELRAHGIHCTSNGANQAAWKGHLDVIQD